MGLNFVVIKFCGFRAIRSIPGNSAKFNLLCGHPCEKSKKMVWSAKFFNLKELRVKLADNKHLCKHRIWWVVHKKCPRNVLVLSSWYHAKHADIRFGFIFFFGMGDIIVFFFSSLFAVVDSSISHLIRNGPRMISFLGFAYSDLTSSKYRSINMLFSIVPGISTVTLHAICNPPWTSGDRQWSVVVSVACSIAPLSSQISQGKWPTVLPLDLHVLIENHYNDILWRPL